MERKHLWEHLHIAVLSPSEVYIYNILYMISTIPQAKHHKWEKAPIRKKEQDLLPWLVFFNKSASHKLGG